MVSAVSLLAMAVVLAILGFVWWRKVPIIFGLAIANFLVFVITILTGEAFTIFRSPLLDDLAARVSYLTDPNIPRLYTVLTSMFLHADFTHVFLNMLVLLMVGVAFEDRVGRVRFLIIYLVSAVVAVLLHGLWVAQMGTPEQLELPLVGASGAVFGILAAFATMYPLARIPMFLVIIFLPRVPVWLAAVVLTALEGLALYTPGPSGVAHAAHLGGAVGGFVLGLLLRPRQTPQEEKRAPQRLDYSTLERLATEPHQQKILQSLKENEDHGDVQRAWLDRLLPSLACSQCARPLKRQGRGRLVCENGHEERYAN